MPSLSSVLACLRRAPLLLLTLPPLLRSRTQVTLRSYLPLSDLAGMNQDLAYRLVAWLCWIPNVIVVELYLQVCFTARECVVRSCLLPLTSLALIQCLRSVQGWLCAPRAKSLSPRSVSPAKQAPSFSGAVSSTQQH